MNEQGFSKCELIHKDMNTLRFEETVDERINEWPHSWPHGEISYRLNNFTQDIEREKWQTRAVTVAFRAWQLYLGKLKFRRERNPDAHVDINISFEDLAHFDNRKGVLAHAYFPGQGDISGDCHINDEWHWVPGVNTQTISKPPLTRVLIHEFGHSLGLRHDPHDTDEVMYPSMNLGLKRVKIGPRSVERMQERYGKRNLARWIIAYFQKRRLEGSDYR